MKYRTMGKLGIQASAFGLGCMRFNGAASGDSVIDEQKAISLIRRAIDGGVTYLDKTSEIVLGKALKDGYRERVTIATKMPKEYVHNREEMQALLDSELKKLQTDYIDFYLMHGINREKWEYFKSIGAPEFFNDMKKAGKIRYKCFSFHGPYADFEYILNDWDWDMVQIQYNFMDVDNQAGTKGLELAGRKGIPVVIMEGLLGGRLSKRLPMCRRSMTRSRFTALRWSGLSAGCATIRRFPWYCPAATRRNRSTTTFVSLIPWKPALCRRQSSVSWRMCALPT